MVGHAAELCRDGGQGGQGVGFREATVQGEAEILAEFFLIGEAVGGEGDFEALLEVLDPNVVFRLDAGGVAPRARPPVEGAELVAAQILERGSPFAPYARPAIVNGNAGVIVVPHETPVAVVGFVVADGRITEIDVIADRAKLRQLR